MARNDPRRFSSEAFDRAQPCAGAESWRALASGMVASALMIAAVIGAFALVDAAVAPPPALLARKAPAPTEQETRRACVLPADKDLTAPMQVDPALFGSD
jgi:hypothetical protein